MAKSYFKPEEFACKHCGVSQMNPQTVEKLNKAREIAGVPFAITSGYRCKAHNDAVGGKSEGAHVSGHAVDISATNSRPRFQIVDALLKAGFTRLGIAKTFIHVDDDPTKDPQVIWMY